MARRAASIFDAPPVSPPLRALPVSRSLDPSIGIDNNKHGIPWNSSPFGPPRRHFLPPFSTTIRAVYAREFDAILDQLPVNYLDPFITRVGRVFLGGAGTGNGRGILYSTSARRGWCFRFGELFEMVNFFKK